ncbi:unnamed protein product [Oikopleura dioica]|uniref:Serpin domain-containing protein n=1 Tax=Oikopleura dioica TaxID=34765 RepID=E4YF00_OIKDI|nr:unnamed protein product [Oikopleura dioica]
MKISHFLLPAVAFASKNGPEQDVTTAFKKKGLELFFTGDERKNTVISPYSIIGSLYMVAAGAGGESREEIFESLNLPQYFTSDKILEPFESYHQISKSLQANSTSKGVRGDPSYELRITNGMFYQEGLRDGINGEEIDPGTFDVLSNDFIGDMANVKALDFMRDASDATEVINKWAEKSTNGKIEELFADDLDADTKVVLASALYVKAQWKNPFVIFTEEKRKSLEFESMFYNYKNSGFESRSDIEWIYQEESILTTSFNHAVDVYELPMSIKKSNGGEPTQMLTVQIWVGDDPDEDISSTVINKYPTIRKQLKRKKLKFIMPKVKLSFKEDIKWRLEKIGIEQIFQEGTADFSPLLGQNSRAFVSKVNHAVEFEIDENGIEGAAVTASVLTSRSMSQPKLVAINRPFYFVVTNRCWDGKTHCPFENIPLFIGRVNDPNETNE